MGDPTFGTQGGRRESEAEWLRRQIDMFERRLATLDQTPTGVAARSPAMPPPPTASAAVSLPASPDLPPPAVSPSPPFGPISPIDVGSMPGSRIDEPKDRTPFALPGIESMLKWAGLVLLFLSAIFLVRTAIQRGWIGPQLQLLGAACIGAALIGGGLVLGRRRSGWDVPLVGVGLAVLSTTATAGWQWLELWAVEPWIAASFVVLALSVALNGRLRSPGTGATGLFSTAASMGVLSESVPQAAVLLAMVVVVGEATSIWRRSASLHLLTVVVGLASFGSVAAVSYFEEDPASVALLLSGAVVTLLFWLMPIVFNIRDTEPSPLGVNWRPTIDRLVISLPALFSAAWAWSSDLSDDRAGSVFLLSGALALASAVAVGSIRRFEQSIWVSQLMGGAAAVTVGGVLLFEGPGVLAGLAVQAAALLVFVHAVPDRWAIAQAGLMAALAGLLALAGMVDAIEVDAPVMDDVVHLGVVGLLAGWAWWEERSSSERRLGRLLGGSAFVGAVLWPVSALVHVPQGQGLISAVWAALGFGLLVLAVSRSSVRLAQVSLVTLGVVMAKLLTVDLKAVDVFWRVALFFLLGGAFLFASFRVGTVIRGLSSGGDPAADDPDPGDPDHDKGLAFQK